MSLHTELHDLMASAPADQRDTLNAITAAAIGENWDRAIELIDTVRTGLTTWHERLTEARERIVQQDIDEDEGLDADEDDSSVESPIYRAGTASDGVTPVYSDDGSYYVRRSDFEALLKRLQTLELGTGQAVAA
jgi:hypothetical protein